MKKINQINWRLFIMPIGFLFVFSLVLNSCGEDTPDYIPGKKTTLVKFYPDKGKFLERVMLVGDNFPTDVSQMKVYFNAKRAAITGSSGTHMTVLAPRLPGGEEIKVENSKNVHRIVNISVVVGKDSMTYQGDFIYEQTTSSYTVVGNGDCSQLVVGSLSEAVIQPTYLCSDKFGNVFVCNRGDGAFGWGGDNGNCGGGRNALLRLNEEEDLIEQLGGDISNAPAADPITGEVILPTESFIGSYYTVHPLEGWIPRKRGFTWAKEYNDKELPSLGKPWKHSMVVNPEDGYIYTRFREGQVVKIHQVLCTAELVFNTGSHEVDCLGLTFRPGEPNILYLAFSFNSSGVLSHGIYTLDVKNPTAANFKRLNAEGAGHRDGRIETALFNCPMQIFTDKEGYIYVADRNNHCIRRITPKNENGDYMVETVLGMPNTPGCVDGAKDVAKFRLPCGIAVDDEGSVYVADGGNNRVRKISVN